jgi:DNA-binding transcriptional regulator YiaG
MSSDMKPAVPDATVGDERKVAVPEGSIAYTVRQLRERTGLTQEQFAAKLGVTFPTINRWENGHAHPSPLALRQIENLARRVSDQG